MLCKRLQPFTQLSVLPFVTPFHMYVYHLLLNFTCIFTICYSTSHVPLPFVTPFHMYLCHLLLNFTCIFTICYSITLHVPLPFVAQFYMFLCHLLLSVTCSVFQLSKVMKCSLQVYIVQGFSLVYTDAFWHLLLHSCLLCSIFYCSLVMP